MRIRYLKAALADLEAIRACLRRSSLPAAQRVVAEIREQIASLSTFASRYRAGSLEGTRELIVVKYGYIVTYRVEAGAIIILAVFHAAQDKPRGG